MNKAKMSQYRDRYMGRPAAILGGGPSLPADMQKLPPNCLLIAVNYHAFLFCKPDFMVYNDDPTSTPELLTVVKEAKVVRVSPDPTTDIFFDVDVWTGFYSSNTAAWFALWMGCNPVILCGMDCYQGLTIYCHPVYVDSPCFHYPLEHHIRPWIEDARNLCLNPDRLRVMSGPLIKVFGQYQA
jgi:hypothetical protein